MKLKVTLISNWFDNPYKQLLIDGLASENIATAEMRGKVFFLPQILRDGKPEILHLQTLIYLFASRNWAFYWVKFLLFLIQLNILKVLGIPTVWTVHEWKDKISAGQHDLSPAKSYLLGKTLTGIITHCATTKQELVIDLKLKQAQKIFVVPHGNYIGCYENNITKHQAREKLGITGDALSFLFFGGIHPSKGVIEAIKAFKSLPHAKIQFTIAGQIPYPTLEQKITREIANEKNILLVNSPGGIPDSEVQTYLNACDIVVLPYRIFTTSGVALLAMSFKRACIAPKQGFFNDILDSRGSFLYPDTPDGLKQAMNQAVARQASLEEMGIFNYELAQKYSWKGVAQQTAKVYQWAMEQS